MVLPKLRPDKLRAILLTGAPRVGKTTAIARLVEHYSDKGRRIEGFTTREVLDNGVRVGFRITDVSNGNEGWLARKDLKEGPRIGAYYVDTNDLEQIGVSALENAVKGAPELIVVDEIGPMEMTSSLFRHAVSRLWTSHNPTLATVRVGSHYPEVELVRPQTLQLELRTFNRGETFQKLILQLEEWMEASRARVQ